MSRNYFYGVIGGLSQRMTDPSARYALALPERPPFLNLVQRYPAYARSRLKLTILFVRRVDNGWAVRVVPPPE